MPSIVESTPTGLPTVPVVAHELENPALREAQLGVLQQKLTLAWLIILRQQMLTAELPPKDVIDGDNASDEALLLHEFEQVLPALDRSVATVANLVKSLENELAHGNEQVRLRVEGALGNFDRVFDIALALDYQTELLEGIRLLHKLWEEQGQLFQLGTFQEKAKAEGISSRIHAAISVLMQQEEASKIKATEQIAPVSKVVAEQAQNEIPAPTVALTPVTTTARSLHDELRAILEATRLDLIDMGLRNPMLDLKRATRKGVEIVGESSSHVFEALVRGGKSLNFMPRPEDVANEVIVTDAQRVAQRADLELQTTHTITNLETRLRRAAHDARSDIEDKGANTLYLAVGMLYWKDLDTGTERRAPLLTIPVKLERPTVTQRYRLRYNDEEIEENLALRARLREELGIELPSLPERDQFNIEKYFSAISEAIRSSQPDFRVEQDEMQLGFFSFSRYLMYRDLDPDVWPAHRSPLEHPVVAALLGQGFPVPKSSLDGLDIDEQVYQLALVMDCDSSQARAILLAMEGTDLAIQGPPGTGKSITITNLIAALVASGKRVAFVSAKAAALQVVKQDLDNLGLGHLALELHGEHVRKKTVVDDLRATLQLGAPKPRNDGTTKERLDESKSYLRSYAKAISAGIRDSELTAHEVMGQLLQLGFNDPERHVFPASLANKWNCLSYERFMTQARDIEAKIAEIGHPASHVFYGSKKLILMPNEKPELARKIDVALSAGNAYQRTIERLANLLKIPLPQTLTEIEHVVSVARLMHKGLSTNAEISLMSLTDPAWSVGDKLLKQILTAGKRYSELYKKYEQNILADELQKDHSALAGKLRQANASWHTRLFFGWSKANKELAALQINPIKMKIPESEKMLKELDELRRCGEIIDRQKKNCEAMFGERLFPGRNSDWELLEQLGNWAIQFNQLAKKSPNYAQYVACCSDASLHSVLDSVLPEVSRSAAQNEASLNELLQFIEFDQMASKLFIDLKLPEQLERLQQWQKQAALLGGLASYNALCARAIESGFEFALREIPSWPQAGKKLVESLQVCYLSSLLHEAFERNPQLLQFDHISHERFIEEFCVADRALMRAHAHDIAKTHWNSIPRVASGGQARVLWDEIGKKSRHLPIRRLLSEAGTALQKAKPVFMMSPQSVARFLAPDSPVEFDVAIFDEASQVRPAESLGITMRAKQVVVSGDTKQLPPTSYYESALKGADLNVQNRTSDLESVLDLFIRSRAPETMLRNHYRSREPSLIGVSNQLYYRNGLRIFPSPVVNQRTHGLLYHYLPDTFYDRGHTSTNIKEAEAVAARVIAHAKNSPGLSLGVVALNSEQAEAILGKVEELIRKDSELERTFFNVHDEAPFFVKSLENVQGDERDVILISVGYARKEANEVLPMTFGPLNLPGGERRLNVLMTRAKVQCEIFTGLQPEDLRVEGRALGVRHLKHFLQYARDRHFAAEEPQTQSASAVSSVQQFLIDKLANLGYRAVPNVGETLDLAVVDPDNPERFIMGIRCDGRIYSSIKNVRERERIIPEVLGARGWKLVNVYTPELFRSTDEVIARLASALEQARKNTASSLARTEARQLIERHALNEGNGSLGIPLYKEAELRLRNTAGKPLWTMQPNDLALYASKVIYKESPVHREEVYLRIRQAAEVSHSESLARVFNQAVEWLIATKAVREAGGFLYLPEQKSIELRDRSKFGSTRKKIELVPPEEISAAIHYVVRHAHGITSEDLPRAALWCLGFRSATETAEAVVAISVRELIEQKALIQQGKFLYLGEAQ